MPARLEFELPLGKPTAARRVARATEPMRLLLLGNFSGQGSAQPLAQRPTLRLDLDNADSVMQKLAPKLALTVAGQACSFEPRSIDDFHPDQLLQSLPPLARGRDLRARLKHTATFAQAAAELGLPAVAAAPADAAPAPAPTAGAPDLLGSLLGGKASVPAAAAPAAPAAQGIDALLRNIVAPHIERAAPEHQAQYVAAAEASLAEQLRAVLHDAGFQQLEAAWRGVHWLLSNLELDDALQLHLFDLRRDEIAADIVAAQGQLAQSGLHAALVDRTRGQPGALAWSALVVLQDFGAGDADIGLLAALGVVASQAAAPVLVAAQPGLLGWRSFAQAHTEEPQPAAGWQQLRGSEVAPWIAAAAPRLLMRMPYGKGLDPIEAFAFEEFNGPPQHDALLWAPGSLALAQMLGRAFSSDGWAGDPQAHREIEGLPAYAFSRDGERELQACAEFYLGDTAMARIAAGGLVGLASHRNLAVAQAQRLQSAALTPTRLAGPWP